MGRRAALPAFVVALSVAGLLAGCGSDEEASVVSLESADRPTVEDLPDETTDAPFDPAFCDALAEVSANPPSDDDPAAAVETLLGLADEAPEELQDDFEVLAEAVDEFAEVEDSPEAMSTVFEIFLRPEVLQASVAIDLYASQECGVELDTNPTEGELPDAETPGLDDGADGDLDDGASASDIDLDDLDQIEADAGAAGATWPDKVIGTSIINDVDVTLSADAGNPFTADEALAACRDVRTALLPRNPELVVTIDNGGTPVASAPAGGECAPA